MRDLLQNTSVEKRLAGTRLLAQPENFEESLFLLVLGDEDWRVRKEAVASFLQLDDAVERLELVLDQLSDSENAGLRNAAIEILIGLGGQIAEQLVGRLASVDVDVRKFLVDILGEIGCADCVPSLVHYLQDEDENVRYAVVETLGKQGQVKAVDSLLGLLNSADTGLQFAILSALASIGRGVSAERVVAYAQDPLLRKAVFSCLGQLCDATAVPVLLDGLFDPQRKNRETAFLALGNLIENLPPEECPVIDPRPQQIIAELQDYLQHEKAEFRKAACYLLSLFADSAIVSNMLPLLADETMRDIVLDASRRIPEAIFLELLDSAGVEDPDSVYLVYLLGELGCSEVEPLALTGAAAADPQLRYASVLTLGKLGLAAALEPLGEALTDEVAEIRLAASSALGQAGIVDPVRTITILTPHLESSEEQIRLLAVKTLGNLPLAAAEDVLLGFLKDPSAAVRCEALRGLNGSQSQQLLDNLVSALEDESAEVRRQVAIAIGAFPVRLANPALRQLQEDPDPWVRSEAIRALTGGTETELTAVFVQALNDPVGVVVIAALETAQRLLPGLMQRLLPLALSHEDSAVVSAAEQITAESLAGD